MAADPEPGNRRIATDRAAGVGRGGTGSNNVSPRLHHVAEPEVLDQL